MGNDARKLCGFNALQSEHLLKVISEYLFRIYLLRKELGNDGTRQSVNIDKIDPLYSILSKKVSLDNDKKEEIIKGNEESKEEATLINGTKYIWVKKDEEGTLAPLSKDLMFQLETKYRTKIYPIVQTEIEFQEKEFPNTKQGKKDKKAMIKDMMDEKTRTTKNWKESIDFEICYVDGNDLLNKDSITDWSVSFNSDKLLNYIDNNAKGFFKAKVKDNAGGESFKIYRYEDYEKLKKKKLIKGSKYKKRIKINLKEIQEDNDFQDNEEDKTDYETNCNEYNYFQNPKIIQDNFLKLLQSVDTYAGKAFDKRIAVKATNVHIKSVLEYLSNCAENMQDTTFTIKDQAILCMLYGETSAKIVQRNLIGGVSTYGKSYERLDTLSSRLRMKKISLNNAWIGGFLGLIMVLKKYGLEINSKDKEGISESDIFDKRWKKNIEERFEALESEGIEVQDAIPMDPTTPELIKKYKEVKDKKYGDKEEKKKNLKQIKKEYENVIKDYVFSEDSFENDIHRVDNLMIMLVCKGIKLFNQQVFGIRDDNDEDNEVDQRDMEYVDKVIIIYDSATEEDNKEEEKVDQHTQYKRAVKTASKLCKIQSYGYLLIEVLKYEIISLEIFKKRQNESECIVSVICEFGTCEDQRVLPLVYPKYIVALSTPEEEDDTD